MNDLARKKCVPCEGGVAPLTPEQVILADEMRFTRDPFDALIVAVARDLRLPLITRDHAIRESGTVRVIW